jgi:hypothetical protein
VHEVHWYRVESRSEGVIDDEAIFSTGFDDNTDGRNVEFRYKWNDPSREGDYE